MWTLFIKKPETEISFCLNPKLSFYFLTYSSFIHKNYHFCPLKGVKTEVIINVNFYYLWKVGYKLWRNLFPPMIVKIGWQCKRYIVKQTHSDFFILRKNTESIMSHIKEGNNIGMTGQGRKIYQIFGNNNFFL